MSSFSTMPKPKRLPYKARSYKRLPQLWQVPLFFVGVAAVVVVACGAAVQSGNRYQRFESDYFALRNQLESAKVDGAVLEEKARQLLTRRGQTSTQSGKAQLLLAEILLRRMDQLDAEQARAYAVESRQCLDEAESNGVLPEDRQRIWYLMGKAEYRTKGDMKLAVRYLRRALPDGANDVAEGYSYLAKAHLASPKPNVDAALAALDSQLQATVEPQRKIAVRFARADLLFRQRRYSEVVASLRNLPSSASQAQRIRATVLLAKSCASAALWLEAAGYWQKLLRTPSVIAGGKREILYQLGNCWENSSPKNRSKAIAAWRQAASLGGDEGRAASIRLATALMTEEQPQFDEVFRHFKNGLGAAANKGEFENGFVSVETVRGQIESAAKSARERNQFSAAYELIQLYAKIGADGRRKQAATVEAWAAYLQQLASVADKNRVEALRDIARAKWRIAANEWLATAKSHSSKPEFLWNAARSFRRAEDYVQAAQSLQPIIAGSQKPDVQSKAWYELAVNLHDAGSFPEARKALYKCIELSIDPYVAQARYRLALDQIKSKKFDAAEATLLENILHQSAQADADAVEKSLYRLGVLFFDRKNYSRAQHYLSKAVELHPDNPIAFTARDYIGECFRRFGVREGLKLKKLQNATLPERNETRRNQTMFFEKAVTTYLELADDLEKLRDLRRENGEEPPLTNVEMLLLRKASFAAADTLFSMNRFDAALRRYDALAETYQGQLEELFACQRIWLCVPALRHEPKQLKDALEATRKVLGSARVTLKKLPDQAFQGTLQRPQWNKYLENVEKELPKYGTKVLRPSLPQPAPVNPPAPNPPTTNRPSLPAPPTPPAAKKNDLPPPPSP